MVWFVPIISDVNLGVLALIFLYFGWSMLPMMYLLAFWYDVPSSGYTKLIFINIATGDCVTFDAFSSVPECLDNLQVA